MQVERYRKKALRVGAETHHESVVADANARTQTGHPDRGRSNFLCSSRYFQLPLLATSYRDDWGQRVIRPARWQSLESEKARAAADRASRVRSQHYALPA